MTEALLVWRDYRYFPYERDFALLEAQRLFATPPQKKSCGLAIPSVVFQAESAERLTYFARAVGASGEVIIPRQTALEASAASSVRTRQATRYSAHCLHEYKGRFNPQVVRAIGNILGLADGSWILDPFCGSGTTLLESAHAGWNAVGIDRNPLAVRIANSKIHALRQAGGRLEELASLVSTKLLCAKEELSGEKEIASQKLDRVLGKGWLGTLPSPEYLKSWFALPVLAQIAAISRVLQANVPQKADRNVFEIILSDLLRGASLQDPADLRIRRRKNPQPNYPLLADFLSSIEEKIERISRAKLTLGNRLAAVQRAYVGDSRRHALKRSKVPSDGYAAVITSPPYETALPYIDTQRLSLIVLGELAPRAIPTAERSLIGAREVRGGERKELERVIRRNESGLPGSISSLCNRLLDAAAQSGNGFRRLNRPALTYRYFLDMKEALCNTQKALSPRSNLALVIGRNRTVLGGVQFEINTPQLLAETAEMCGFQVVEMRPMNTYPRYDLHQKNSIGDETLVLLGHAAR